MDIEILLIILFIAAIAFWLRRRDHKIEAANPSRGRIAGASVMDTLAISNAEPFLEEIAASKNKADESVECELGLYEQELKSRFYDDIQMRERLTRITREQELDKAIVKLWKEIESYPLSNKRAQEQEKLFTKIWEEKLKDDPSCSKANFDFGAW